MRILVSAVGSHGDTLPFVALGKALRDRGHDVRIYANAYFESFVREAGLTISPIGTAEDHLRGINDPDITHPIRFLRVIVRALDKELAAAHDAMAADILPGNTAIVGGVLAFAARSVAELRRIPMATVHLQPTFFRSKHATMRMGPSKRWHGAPGFLRPLGWWLIDRLIVDKTIGAAVNRYRVERGLRPIRRLFDEWLHQADALIGMFPQWFAPPQPDWPSHLQLTGFPLYDRTPSDELPPAVEAFLAAGEPPVAFTSGTAIAAARAFFETSVEACRRSGRRGILLTPHEAQVPPGLPPSIARFDYVPFSTLLPRVAAFVHHGGIGTTSQALRAGVPQLIRPVIADQFDNSIRAQRLGVAYELLPTDYTVAAVVTALDQLSRNFRSRCAELAELVETDGVAVACDRILEGVNAFLGNSIVHNRSS